MARRSGVKPKRSHKQDRLAKIYDAEILPIWSERFGRMLMRKLAVPPKAMVLDVGGGTGYPALEVLRRMDDQGRIISIDPSSPMLDVARAKAGSLGGKRIFFRSESVEPRLTFADDVFDLVISNLTLQDLDDPAAAIAEFARVAKPGGRVICTFPLAGTFAEFLDLFREVLIKADRADALERLEHYLAETPTAARARDWFEHADLLDVQVEHEEFKLLFKSSREFFFAPLIEYGPLPEWKEVAGKGEEMQDAFWKIKEAIDAYFGGGSFAVTVRAACVSGRKPLEEERHAFAERSAPPPREEAPRGPQSDGPTVEVDLLTAEHLLGTGEFELLEESEKRLAVRDDDEEIDEELLPSTRPGKGVGH
jgi:ubiquinone/menaquinone biosynthesis C-methylase UbiE